MIGRRQRLHPHRIVQAQLRAVPGDFFHRAHAAGNGQELARRIHLHRPRGQGQGQGARPAGGVGQVVTPPKLRLIGRPVCEAGDLQRPVVGGPGHGRDRQVAVLQSLFDIDVGPCDQPSVVHHEGLDAGAGAAQFDGAVLADQAAFPAPIDPDQGPIGLFAREAARIEAAPVLLGHRLDEDRGVGAEGQGLDLDLIQHIGRRRRRAQPLSRAGRTHHVRRGNGPQRLQPQPARRRLGRPQPVDAAVAARHGRQFAPVASVQGGRNAIVGGRAPLAPSQGQTAKLTLIAQVTCP